MFYALKFGEVPPPGVRPMQPRGEDNRLHIFSKREPDAKALQMGATSDWAKHVDPTSAEAAPPKSALALARLKKKEIAEKPQASQAVVQAAEPPRASLKPPTTTEPPFATAVAAQGADKGLPKNTAALPYGAFGASVAMAVPQRNAAAAAATGGAVETTAQRIVDTVPAHAVLKNEASAAAVGAFAPVTAVSAAAPNTIQATKADVMSHDELGRLVMRSIADIPPNVAPPPAVAAAAGSTAPSAVSTPRYPGLVSARGGAPQQQRPGGLAPYGLPATAAAAAAVSKTHGLSHQQGESTALPTGPQLTSSALQALGTWRYRHTAQAAGANARQTRGTASTEAVSDTVAPPADAPGPQIDWWLKGQRKYQPERTQEGRDDLKRAITGDGKIGPEGDPATEGRQGTAAAASVLAVPAQPKAPINSNVAAMRASIPTAVVTAGVVKPPPNAGASTAVVPAGVAVTAPPGTRKALPAAAGVVGPKPADPKIKAVEAHLPPPPPVHTAIPIATQTMPADSPVVQTVGGPPPTSIARRTLDTIRAEREAHLRARWLLEAPARAAACQQKVDALMKSLRVAVESKGFSEPTKGAQYVIKTCRQFTSSKDDAMTLRDLATVLEKGFSVVLADANVLEALFERMDVTQTAMISFRVFGEMIFELYRAPEKGPGQSVLANPTARQLIEDIKTKIAQRHAGEAWLLAFSCAFKTLRRLGHGSGGDDSDAALDAKELQQSLSHLGVHISLRDANNLVAAMDRDKSGTVDAEEFLYALRGPMPRARRELVFRAFNILDKDRSGAVTLDEIAACYDASKHPRVLSGEATPEQVLGEFIQLWNRDGDSIISWKEFLDYYSTLSASIENDEYFELMMRNAWHITGGTGAAENTTCRRVLVTFTDKTQRVIELENDLGIGPKDLDKMRSQLALQGVTGIERIDLYG